MAGRERPMAGLRRRAGVYGGYRSSVYLVEAAVMMRSALCIGALLSVPITDGIVARSASAAGRTSERCRHRPPGPRLTQQVPLLALSTTLDDSGQHQHL
jgi:hypothetical protein